MTKRKSSEDLSVDRFPVITERQTERLAPLSMGTRAKHLQHHDPKQIFGTNILGSPALSLGMMRS